MLVDIKLHPTLNLREHNYDKLHELDFKLFTLPIQLSCFKHLLKKDND